MNKDFRYSIRRGQKRRKLSIQIFIKLRKLSFINKHGWNYINYKTGTQSSVTYKINLDKNYRNSKKKINEYKLQKLQKNYA